jgi:Flp pilus assembly protein TadD
LKSGRLDSAIADYDEALRLDANNASSLYGRGLAKQKKGDAVGAADDIAAATALQADIAAKSASRLR